MIRLYRPVPIPQDIVNIVEALIAGGEPSIAEKRRAKELAWDQGLAPDETIHRVILGDSRSPETLPLGESIHLVVTSPPYFNLVDYEQGETPGQLGEMEEYENFLDQLDRVWIECLRRLSPGGRMCIVVGDVCLSRRQGGRHHVLPLHADIGVRCRKLGFDYLTPILWSKIANANTEVGGPTRFLGKPYEPNGIIKNDVEYILLLRKPGSYRKPSSVQRALSLLDAAEHSAWYRSIWSDIRGESRKLGHPAPYPEELAYRLIRLFSFVGDTVLDPFWGTGTTTAAAIKASRNSVGIEIEPSYISIGRKRLSQVDAMVPARLVYPS